MCTIGYDRKLNLLYKNRDKNVPTSEVMVVRSNLMGVKTEGAEYLSLGTNRHGCGFVASAVNTPTWTALASEGKVVAASEQARKENEGLTSPTAIATRLMPDISSVDEWVEGLLNSGQSFMGYNLLLADEEKAVRVEVHGKDSHVSPLGDRAVVTNHFHHLDHGPQQEADYPNSFERLAKAKAAAVDFASEEDVFRLLKPHNGTDESLFWRKGVFFTVSSSVVDLDTRAIYYAPSPEDPYSRISGSIPPKGSGKVLIEMSRYIDLPTYHKIERGHAFYEEMIAEVIAQVTEFYNTVKGGEGTVKVLEFGAGTGLCSLELVKHAFVDLDCLELDGECCKILESHPQSSEYNVFHGNAMTYCKAHHYDLVVSTFAHDHIHYDLRYAFAVNIYNNLKKGGRYVMGGEMLPYYSGDQDRKKALFKYHNYIIACALEEDRIQLSELENNALKSGLDMVGDFKGHESMFEGEMKSAGFTQVFKRKIGPVDRNDVGGVMVYVLEA